MTREEPHRSHRQHDVDMLSICVVCGRVIATCTRRRMYSDDWELTDAGRDPCDGRKP